MDFKLRYLRLVSIGNYFIGVFSGILGAIGIYNLLTDSSIGIAVRRSRSGGMALSTGEEVFWALFVAGIAGLFYISLDKIQENEGLENLFYHVLDSAFKRFYFLTAILLIGLASFTDPHSSMTEILFFGFFFSFFLVMHFMVISTVFFTRSVMKFSLFKVAPKPKSPIQNRLYELRELHDKGLISTEEYEEKRAEILNSL